MPLKISVMSGKMEHIPALNTSPMTNPFCQRMCKTKTVCQFCYSRQMLQTSRMSCNAPWVENGKILSSSIIPENELPVFNSVWFRFAGHGELLNATHFINLCNIAKKNPRTHFVLWSKRCRIVRENLSHVPNNLRLIYSNPKLDCVVKNPPKGFHKVFNVVTKDSYKSNCAGKSCWQCGICYDATNDTTCIVERLRTRYKA